MREITWSLDARVKYFGVFRFLSFRISGKSHNSVIDPAHYIDTIISNFLYENKNSFERSQGSKNEKGMEAFDIRYKPAGGMEKIIDKLLKCCPAVIYTDDPFSILNMDLRKADRFTKEELFVPIPAENEKRIEISAGGFISGIYNVYELLEEIVFELPITVQLYISFINARKMLGMLTPSEYARQCRAISNLQRENTHQNEIKAYTAVFKDRIKRLKDDEDKRKLVIRRAKELEQYSKLDALGRYYREDVANVAKPAR